MDLEQRVMWVEGYQSKNGSAFNLPLSAEAILVLRRQQGKHPHWVFTYQRDRVKRGFEVTDERPDVPVSAWVTL